MFKSDSSGPSLTAEVKLSNAYTTWNTRINQLANIPGKITICTFSMENFSYIEKILSKREHDITLLCNSRYEYQAKRVKEMLPGLDVYCSSNCHAKLALVEPGTVWVSSENLGKKRDSFDASIGIYSTEAYDHFYAQVERLLKASDTIHIDDDYLRQTQGRIYYRVKEKYGYA